MDLFSIYPDQYLFHDFPMKECTNDEILKIIFWSFLILGLFMFLMWKCEDIDN